jgi:hypothetical protein
VHRDNLLRAYRDGLLRAYRDGLLRTHRDGLLRAHRDSLLRALGRCGEHERSHERERCEEQPEYEERRTVERPLLSSRSRIERPLSTLCFACLHIFTGNQAESIDYLPAWIPFYAAYYVRPRASHMKTVLVPLAIPYVPGG